jgi:ATP synthase protein I
MPELPEEEIPERPRELDGEVGAREVRKIRARRQQDRTIWFGLGMFGLVGWSVAIPTVLGVALGVWLDMTWPGRFSWTLALLLAGATLGCLNAWYWVSQEQEAMDREREGNHE